MSDQTYREMVNGGLFYDFKKAVSKKFISALMEPQFLGPIAGGQDSTAECPCPFGTFFHVLLRTGFSGVCQFCWDTFVTVLVLLTVLIRDALASPAS